MYIEIFTILQFLGRNGSCIDKITDRFEINTNVN